MEEKEKEIWYLSFETHLFPIGTTEISVKEGIVNFADNTTAKLSNSLKNIGIKEAGVLFLYTEKSCKIQFGKLGWINLKPGTHFLNRAHISLFRLDFENTSDVNFVIFIDKETEFFYVK